MSEEDKNMPAIEAKKDAASTPKKKSQFSPGFLATAQRLPVENGKIVLDRNNPDHVKWDTER